MNNFENTHKLNFTPEQRVLLATQIKILQTLTDDLEEQEFYNNYLEVLICGFEPEYDDLWYELNFLDPFPEAKASEVKEILEMYDDLAKVYQRLNKEDQKSIGIFSFPGFDANEEIQHYLYTDFLLRNKHPYVRLSRFIDGYCPSSHQPTLGEYRSMLEIWSPWNRNNEQLTKDLFFEILKLQPKTQ